MDDVNNELPTCSVLSGDFNARCSKRLMILAMQMVAHLILSHNQQDINKLLTSVLIL